MIGAFLAVDPDPVEATTTALAYFGLAGEKAALHAKASGTYQIALLDALFSIDEGDLRRGAKIEVLR
jgi:hydroxyethylthiazole kinase